MDPLLNFNSEFDNHLVSKVDSFAVTYSHSRFLLTTDVCNDPKKNVRKQDRIKLNCFHYFVEQEWHIRITDISTLRIRNITGVLN